MTFELEPHNESADVILDYVHSIDSCGWTYDPSAVYLGCAPIGPDVGQTVVELRENDDDKQLLQTTEHELGHVLGIGHGEPPMPLMAPNNVYLLASPWHQGNLTYYVDYSDKPGYSKEYLDGKILPAFEYFESGAKGSLDTPPTFTRVSSRADANVVVNVHQNVMSESTFVGSTVRIENGTVSGTYYRRVTIDLYHLDTQTLAWHVAYWLAPEVFPHSSDIPDYLKGQIEQCDYECRHGDWFR